MGWHQYNIDTKPETVLPEDYDPNTEKLPELVNFYKLKGHCVFCKNTVGKQLSPNYAIEYYNVQLLHQFINERGAITNRRINRNCAKHQRAVAVAVKRARFIGLLDHSSDWRVQDYVEECEEIGYDTEELTDEEELVLHKALEDTEEAIAAALAPGSQSKLAQVIKSVEDSVLGRSVILEDNFSVDGFDLPPVQPEEGDDEFVDMDREPDAEPPRSLKH